MKDWIIYWINVAEAVTKAFQEVPTPEYGNVKNMVNRLCIGGKLDGQRKRVNPVATGMAAGGDTYRLVSLDGDSFFVVDSMSMRDFERFYREVLAPCMVTRA